MPPLVKVRWDFIVELFSRQAAAPETLAGVSESLCICVECVIEFFGSSVLLGILRVPSLLIVVRHGWKKLSRVWIAYIV